MKKLTLGNFKREGIQGSFGHYFSHILSSGEEMCLEACLEGYDIALYDKNKNLIGEKVCTRIEGMMEMQIMPGFSMGTGVALEKAVEIANEKLKEFFIKKHP